MTASLELYQLLAPLYERGLHLFYRDSVTYRPHCRSKLNCYVTRSLGTLS